ncbi:MAG TPA: hypothetical protein VER55_07715, partial [Ardenticatenaceae bacterium]|nr:hypothetical protein [Ardenticatenaceae bacterium]
MRFRVLLVVLALVAFGLPINATAATNAWSAWSGPAAQIVDVAISTSAANEIYAISKNAVFRSNDGGSTWQSLAAPGGSELNDIAVESWPTTRLYVANYAGQGQPGLYRSDDVGQSWQAVFSGDPPAISKVTVSDDPPGRVTIGGDDRFPSSHYAILQSDDRGATWREVYRAQSTFGAGAITTLAPYGNSVLAGTLVYHGGGLLRVPSEGATFLEGSRPQNGFSTPGTIATGRTAAYPIYVQWTANGPFVLASLRKSSDGGQSWQDVTPPLQGNSGEQATQSGPHLTALAVDPAHPNIVLVAANWADAAGRPTVGVLMSRDGGATWAQLGGALPVARIGALAYSEARQSVYAATDQGVWQYTISAPPPSAEIAPWFRAYYDAHDGFRLLGRPLAPPGMTGRYPSQLFEKGRVEDHSAEESDPNWRIMYG